MAKSVFFPFQKPFLGSLLEHIAKNIVVLCCIIKIFQSGGGIYFITTQRI